MLDMLVYYFILKSCTFCFMSQDIQFTHGNMVMNILFTNLLQIITKFIYLTGLCFCQADPYSLLKHLAFQVVLHWISHLPLSGKVLGVKFISKLHRYNVIKN